MDMHHLSNILEDLILQSLSHNSPTEASKVILRATGPGFCICWQTIILQTTFGSTLQKYPEFPTVTFGWALTADLSGQLGKRLQSQHFRIASRDWQDDLSLYSMGVWHIYLRDAAYPKKKAHLETAKKGVEK